MICFLLPHDELSPSALTLVIELVSHGSRANIESKANGLSRVLHVATPLNDVFRCDIKGSWAVLLLKAS